MDLIMLGTGNALVTECYNTCFVLREHDHYFMVDGGGGNTVLHQLKHANVDWKEVRTIFVTHRHVDHLLGIVWMIRMICQYMDQGQYEGDATIYAHDEVIGLLHDLAEKLLKKSETAFIGRRLHLIPVQDGEQKTILGKTVTFFDIRSTKAKQFGFCMELGSGQKLTCCGDEPFHPCERKYAQGSKWLLHEAFCRYSQAALFDPYEKHHSTVKDACELAAELDVQNLVLYHTEDLDLPHRKQLYAEEGSRYFSGNLFIPDDLETIAL